MLGIKQQVSRNRTRVSALTFHESQTGYDSKGSPMVCHNGYQEVLEGALRNRLSTKVAIIRFICCQLGVFRPTHTDNVTELKICGVANLQNNDCNRHYRASIYFVSNVLIYETSHTAWS